MRFIHFLYMKSKKELQLNWIISINLDFSPVGGNPEKV